MVGAKGDGDGRLEGGGTHGHAGCGGGFGPGFVHGHKGLVDNIGEIEVTLAGDAGKVGLVGLEGIGHAHAAEDRPQFQALGELETR